MTRTAVYPEGLTADDIPLKLSPGILSNGHLFLTGITGNAPDGTMPEDPETQFRSVFAKIGGLLEAGGSGFDHVVEITSYHVQKDRHFDCFEAVHGQFVKPPYPAWTAVEVAGLRRPRALVEVRTIAVVPER